MPERTSARIPRYRLHKPTGLAVVRLNGRDIYLGKHGRLVLRRSRMTLRQPRMTLTQPRLTLRGSGGGLHGFTEPVTFAVHLEDVAAMGQAVQQRRGHAFALEDLTPIAEGQVTGDQQAGPLIAIGEDLEEQLGTRTAE